jgi:hypothetical protein
MDYEDGLKLLQLAMTKLGVSEDKPIGNRIRQKSKNPLDELNEIVKNFETTLKTALRIAKKFKQRRVRKFQRKIQKELKKAQAFDNMIASKTVNESPEINENADKRKRAIRDAISISQSRLMTKQKVNDLKQDLYVALASTKKFKTLASEALIDDEAEDEPMQDFIADDEVMLNVVKKIRSNNDSALIGQARRLALTNKIEGVNVQSKINVNEQNDGKSIRMTRFSPFI